MKENRSLTKNLVMAKMEGKSDQGINSKILPFLCSSVLKIF